MNNQARQHTGGWTAVESVEIVSLNSDSTIYQGCVPWVQGVTSLSVLI